MSLVESVGIAFMFFCFAVGFIRIVKLLWFQLQRIWYRFFEPHGKNNSKKKQGVKP